MTSSPSFIPETAPPFTEDDVSKIPAIALLMKLGYQYLLPKETLKLRGGRRSSVILYGVLEQQLRKMNRILFRGENVPFTEGNIAEAIRVLRDMDNDGLVRTNEKIWDLIRLGKALPQTIQGDTKSFTLQYVDWERPENNVYHVTDEFVVEASGTTDTRRPDIVLFVNGIPFSVIECKRPGLPVGKDPIEEAIQQQIRNQGRSEIPRLFHYAQLLFALAMNQASYGATGTPLKFWFVWKEKNLDDVALSKIVNQPLDEASLSHLFTSDQYRFNGTTPEQARDWFEGFQASERSITDQDCTLYSLCRPERLLEMADRFTLFDAGERKIARYQQYFCVQLIMDRILTVGADGVRQGGVVWHTQGSGKSITMVFLAEAIARESAIKDPKIILVTDRVDLDDQIYRTFDHCGLELVQAKTGTHLQDLLNDPKARIITTIINKFQASKDDKIDDPNIFALIDESHRTQFGTLHTAMRRVLSKACLIGFTGTPLYGKDKNTDTMATFGGLIDSYTLRQAVPDRAVVPLLYEGRHVPQEVDRKQIDLWFERYTAGLTDKQQADLKKKFSTAEQLNQAEQKIRAIAWDISYHYSTEWQGTGFKAQLVTPSKAAALNYKRFLDEFGKVSSAVLISPPDTSEGNTEVGDLRDDSHKGRIQQFWQQMLERYGSEDRYQKDLIQRFKHGDEPEIIIVVDKLLTGFDAPRNTVLYLTRSLKDHRLLQAIARVNRLYDGKDFGYIIDYYGVLQRLGDALDLYGSLDDEFAANTLDDTLLDVSEEWKKLEQRHSDVWEVFQGVPNKQDMNALLGVLADEEIRPKFYDRLSIFARTLKLALASLEFYSHTSDEKRERYKTDLKFFTNLRAAAARLYAERVDFKQYQNSIQKLIDTHVGTDEIETVVELVNIFDKEAFQAEIDAQESPISKAEMIANRTKRTITERLPEDPAFYTPFSKMLDEIIQSIRNQRFEDAETLLNDVEEIRDQVRDRTRDDVPDQLQGHDVAKAYYGVVQENLAGIGSLELHINGQKGQSPSYNVKEAQVEYDASPSPQNPLKELSADIALKIEAIVNEHRIVNWIQNSDIQNRMKTAIEDMLFEIQDDYDFELDFDIIDIILEKCIDIARIRVP